MYQSQFRNQGSFPTTDPKLSHNIEITCLAILYACFFTCLIRSDYNFPVIFFIYFVWQQRKDSLALKIMLAAVILVSIFDLLFVFTEVRVWVQTDQGNAIWNTLRSMHIFAIICFSVIMLLKIILMVFIGKGISQINKAVQHA